MTCVMYMRVSASKLLLVCRAVSGWLLALVIFMVILGVSPQARTIRPSAKTCFARRAWTIQGGESGFEPR